jgi:hypothetical protein
VVIKTEFPSGCLQLMQSAGTSANPKNQGIKEQAVVRQRTDESESSCQTQCSCMSAILPAKQDLRGNYANNSGQPEKQNRSGSTRFKSSD